MPQRKSVRVGECKSDDEIFVELARKMGLEHCTESVEETLDQQLRDAGLDLTYAELCKRGYYEMDLKYTKYQENGFNTPSRRRAQCRGPILPTSTRWS